MAAGKISCKESERTEIYKPWITFCACRWKAPTYSKPDPSKVTDFYIKSSRTDTAIICYNFPCQKINWLRLTLNSSQICTKLAERFVYLKKTFDKSCPSFGFLQKPESKQYILGLQFGTEVLQAVMMRPRGNSRKDRHKKENLWNR